MRDLGQGGFRTGKLPHDVLRRLLAKVQPSDPRVILAGEIGEDAAVIEFGETYLVAKTDPITFATEEIGWYAVQVNANDVASMGAVPRWFLAAVLLPEESATESLAEAIFEQIQVACGSLGVALVGGHTEISHGLSRPIVVGHMLGEAAKEKLRRTADALPGDALVLTKGIPLEGASIIAREKGAELTAKGLQAAVVDRAANYLHAPGISVVKEALIAAEIPGVHAMHDPTEGGLATGLYELADAARVGILLEEKKIPLLEEGEAICSLYGLDPLGTIASGALLISVSPGAVGHLLAALKAADVEATLIGSLQPPEFGVQAKNEFGQSRPLPRFESDEIARIF